MPISRRLVVNMPRRAGKATLFHNWRLGRGAYGVIEGVAFVESKPRKRKRKK